MTQRITLAAFKAAKVHRQYCELGPKIAKLPPAERRDYQAAMDDRTISTTAILTVLEARGLKVNRTTVQHHRRGVCSNCFGVANR